MAQRSEAKFCWPAIDEIRAAAWDFAGTRSLNAGNTRVGAVGTAVFDLQSGESNAY